MSQRSLISDTRGAVFVEYIVLVVFVGLVVAIALTKEAPRTLRVYSIQRAALYQSNP